MSRARRAAGALALLAAQACRSPSSAPSDAGVEAAPRAALDLEAFRARARVPGLAAVAVSRDGVRFEGAVGLADAPGGTPATVDTRFPAASLAKVVVALVATRLAESHRLGLDEDASRALPFPLRHPEHPDRTVSVRMLLEHTSGLRDDWGRLEADRPDAGEVDTALLAFLRGYVGAPTSWTADAPGQGHRYANVGTALAAIAMARRNETTFEHLAETEVFAPLGMRASSFGAGPGPVARGHAARDGGYAALPLRERLVYPATGLVTSARDAGKLARVLLRSGDLEGRPYLRAGAARALLQPALGIEPIALAGREGALVGHEGEDGGVSVALVLDAARGVGAVVLTNGDAFASGDAGRARALSDLARALLALP